VFCADFVGSVLLEDDVDAGDEFAADCAEGGAMRFALLALSIIVGVQFVIMHDGH
jgi:hypothetical protein